MTTTSDSSNDDFLTWMIGLVAVMLLGPGLLAKFVPQAQQALVNAHILVVDDILIPIGEGTGLDLARVLIVVGAIALLVLLVVVSVRRRMARTNASRSRA